MMGFCSQGSKVIRCIPQNMMGISTENLDLFLFKVLFYGFDLPWAENHHEAKKTPFKGVHIFGSLFTICIFSKSKNIYTLKCSGNFPKNLLNIFHPPPQKKNVFLSILPPKMPCLPEALVELTLEDPIFLRFFCCRHPIESHGTKGRFAVD